MSPPLISVEGGGQSNVSLAQPTDSGLKERNYFGLSGDRSTVMSLSSDDNKGKKLNLKATELRLGLPGSQSPERDSQPPCLMGMFDEKPLFPLTPLKTGNKRGFSDTTEEFVADKGCNEGNWTFMASGSSAANGKTTARMNVMPSANTGVKKDQSGGAQQAVKDGNPKSLQELPRVSSNNNAPAAKAQVVGWPPIRSFRKNSLATSSKNDEVDGKPGAGPLFMKVSMDGAPYLRKVDLRLCSTYQELSNALEKMFSCFTLGQCGTGAPGKENLSESKLKDLLHGSEYVLTYEDKDGDWMLVGDVPWEMFIDSCKRLKIMKSSDAIGLAPRAMEKSRNRN